MKQYKTSNVLAKERGSNNLNVFMLRVGKFKTLKNTPESYKSTSVIEDKASIPEQVHKFILVSKTLFCTFSLFLRLHNFPKNQLSLNFSFQREEEFFCKF